MIPKSFQDKKNPAKMAFRVTGAFMGLVPLPDLKKFDAACVIAAFKWFFIDPSSQYSCCVDSLDRDSLLFSFIATSLGMFIHREIVHIVIRAFIIGNELRNFFSTWGRLWQTKTIRQHGRGKSRNYHLCFRKTNTSREKNGIEFMIRVNMLFGRKLRSTATDALARRGFLQRMKNSLILVTRRIYSLMGIGTCVVTADMVVTVSTVVTAYTAGTVVTASTEPGVGFGPTEQARSES